MRDFVIHVHAVPSGGSHSASQRHEDGQYHVYVDENEIKEYGIEPVAVTAHEIGHALGFEFQLPKHRELQVAYALGPWSEVTSEEGAWLDHNREIEAWSVARAMFDAEGIGLGLHHLAHQAQIEHERRIKQFAEFIKKT
jgi:hypothetical protein